MFPCFLFRLPGAIPHRETPVTYLACIKVFTLLFDVGFVTFLCFLFVSSFRQVFIWFLAMAMDQMVVQLQEISSPIVLIVS